MILLQWLLAVAYVVLRSRFVFNPKLTANIFAAQLLDDYSADELNETGVKQYATDRYMRLVATFGLPSSAVDSVANHCWSTISQAQGNAVGRIVQSLYT